MEHRSIYNLDIESIQFFSQYLWEKNDKKKDEFNFRLLSGPTLVTQEGKLYYYDRLKIHKSVLQKNIYIFTYQMTYQNEGVAKELSFIVNTELLSMNPLSFLFYLFYLFFCFILC